MKETLLELLSQKRIDWIRMTKSFGSQGSPVPDYLVDDIVHDMYIKLHNKYGNNPERIMFEPGKLNTMLVYVTLRSLFVDYHRKQKHRNYFPQDIIEELNVEGIEVKVEQLHELDRIELIMQSEIETWHHYDKKLFKLIYYDGMSMRKLSRETNISLSSIFNTCKVCKMKLKEVILLDKQI